MKRFATSQPMASSQIPAGGWTWDSGRSTEHMVFAPQLPGADRGGSAESFRRAVTLERRMLLEGKWRYMLRSYGLAELGQTRHQVVGNYDISSNIFKQLVVQTSTLYDRAAQLRGRDTEAIDRLHELLKHSNYWGVSARHQRNVNAYRDSLLRYTWTKRGVHAVPVSPDFVYVEPDAEDPGRPALIRQAVWRKLPDGFSSDCGWTVDDWDLRDPDWPRFRVLAIEADPDNTDEKHDLTAYYIAPGRPSDWWGERYPYRFEGEAIMPYRLDHAEQTGTLWAARENAEVVHGTLQVGILMTAFHHAALRASWAQRVLLNGRVPAAAPLNPDEDGGGYNPQHTEADPTMILNVEDDGKGNGASIDEWGSPVDLDSYLTAIDRYAQRMAVHFGLSPADVVLSESRQAASGVAIEVSHKGQRRLEARQAPLFETYDEEGFTIIAALDRAHTGTRWEPREISLDYAYTEQDPEERARLLELLQAERAEGLISRRQMYARLNRCSEEEAEEALAVVVQQEAEEAPVATAQVLQEAQASPEAPSTQPVDDPGTIQQPTQPAQREEVEPRPESREFLVGDKTTALAVVEKMAAGALSRETALELLTTMIGLSDDEAQRMLAEQPTAEIPQSGGAQDAQVITAAAHPSLLAETVHALPAEPTDLQRLAEALGRMGAAVELDAEVPEGTRGLTTYADSLIQVAPGTPKEQVIVLAHEGGHWLEHVRTGSRQAADPELRERAAFDLGWGLVQALGLDASQQDYRDLHEARLAELVPVERSEARRILEDVAEAAETENEETENEETEDVEDEPSTDTMGEAPKLLLSLLIPPAVHEVWEAAQTALEDLAHGSVELVGSPHITLLYLGEVEPDAVGQVEGAVAARLAEQSAVQLRLSGVDTFEPSDSSEGRYPVYLSVEAPDLEPLHADLRAELEALGGAEQHEGYTPHITLGYLPADTPEAQLDAVRSMPVEPLTWESAQVVISSRGEEIAALAMRGDPPPSDSFTEDFRSKRFTIPAAVEGNAAKVLGWREEHGDAVKGMTETGWRRARQLAEAREVTGQDLIEIAAWFSRFSQQGEDYSAPAAEVEGEPWRDAGHVAWEGWGGDSAKTWATEIVGRNREG